MEQCLEVLSGSVVPVRDYDFLVDVTYVQCVLPVRSMTLPPGALSTKPLCDPKAKRDDTKTYEFKRES